MGYDIREGFDTISIWTLFRGWSPKGLKLYLKVEYDIPEELLTIGQVS